MDENPGNGMRKTTKAAITASFALLSIRPLMDLKSFIVGEQVVTNARLELTIKETGARLEAKLDKHIDDETVTHRRIKDLTVDDIKASEARCEKHSDKVEDRVSNLEQYAFKTLGGRGRSTN